MNRVHQNNDGLSTLRAFVFACCAALCLFACGGSDDTANDPEDSEDAGIEQADGGGPQNPCGNGAVEAALGEECDDGNDRDGDGCSKNCRVEDNFVCETANTGRSLCQCKDGFSGAHCTECRTGFLGDKCDDCAPGYWGDNCENLCPGAPDNTCSGQGTCSDGRSGTGKCTCNDGILGNACSGCEGNFTGQNCGDCLPGYAGSDCAKACPVISASYVTAGVCGKGGTCNEGVNGDGTCECDTGWAVITSSLDAQTIGACGKCADGYALVSGADGDYTCVECPGHAGGSTCGGHGKCLDQDAAWRLGLEPGTCSCDVGWTGENCDRCAPGYYGSRCEDKCPGAGVDTSGVVPVYNSPDKFCNGHGTCSDGLSGTGKCTCNARFRGDNCEVCADGYYGTAGSPCSVRCTKYFNNKICARIGGSLISGVYASDCRFRDTRDNTNYDIVCIEDMLWFARNLEFQSGHADAFNNDNNNKSTYGYLYNWNEAKTACPEGWRLPTESEYDALRETAYEATFGNGDTSSYEQKIFRALAKDKTKWNVSYDLENTLGFGALPGGRWENEHCTNSNCSNTTQIFDGLGDRGFWWSSTAGAGVYSGKGKALQIRNYDYGGVSYVEVMGFDPNDKLSVRCVQK